MKKGHKQYDLRIRLKTGIIILGVVLATLFFPLPAYAETNKTATLSADIKNKLKALQVEIASKAAKLKIEVGQKLQNRVYVGFIKSKSDNTITIAADNNSKLVTVNDYTQYLGAKKGIKLSSLNSEDYIAALGDVDDTEVLTAKKIIRLSPAEERKIMLGTVVSISPTAITLVSEGKTKNMMVDKDTVYEYSKGQVSLDQIKLSQLVIVVVTTQKDASYARFVYLTNNNKPHLTQPKPATNSASPSSQQKLKTKSP